MTITLDLTPETEASLLAQAEARGLSLDAFLKTIITNQAAAAKSIKPWSGGTHEGEELERAIDDIFDTVQVPRGVGEGAMRCENWYR
jgi:hypothetical protein